MDRLDPGQNVYGITNVITHDYFVGNFLLFRNITKIPFIGWSGALDMEPMYMMRRAMVMQNRSITSKAKFSVKENSVASICEAAVKLMRPFHTSGQKIPNRINDDDQILTLILA